MILFFLRPVIFNLFSMKGDRGAPSSVQQKKTRAMSIMHEIACMQNVLKDRLGSDFYLISHKMLMLMLLENMYPSLQLHLLSLGEVQDNK